MKTGPYTLCHTDRGSTRWWAWPSAVWGLGMFLAAAAMPAAEAAQLLAGSLWFSAASLPLVWLAAEGWQLVRHR